MKLAMPVSLSPSPLRAPRLALHSQPTQAAGSMLPETPPSSRKRARGTESRYASITLDARPPHDAASIGVWHLLGHSTKGDVLTEAFAWVIATYCNPQHDPCVPALGMHPDVFAGLLATRFPHFVPPQRWLAAQQGRVGKGGALDEFPDLLQLLLDHRAVADEHHRCVAHLVATACMGTDHLWQDLGLPGRKELSALLAEHFPMLAAKNAGDMKWKKFFYKQLCEREGIGACRSPSCAACCDYDKCFGAEI
jgi:nitrogen fixation protein NifQ